jgi:UDP-GlcNAc3NAcA epimerase
MKVLTILGARPQFIKAATVSRAVRDWNRLTATPEIEEVIVHTGQHFDHNMSQVFFEQLDIPAPDYNLGIGSLGHGAMTGRMLEGIEGLIQKESPDWLLVYGDTNSTLAGSLAAAKAGVPVAHVEAGLRSFNPAMPEEVNRVLTDRISALLLCPTDGAIKNLVDEGFPHPPPGRHTQRIENVGDVMYDATLHYRDRAMTEVDLDAWGLIEGEYALCTLHRAENTDDLVRLRSIVQALIEIGRDCPVVWPLHPRTKKKLTLLDPADRPSEHPSSPVRLIEPLPYLEMQRLQMSARVILTDSGGVQKEAFFHRVPCVTLRDETEWIETLLDGANVLVGAAKEAIVSAFQRPAPVGSTATPYGRGQAAPLITQLLLER